MKKIKLIFKNLYYLVKTRKVFFMLMCLGQIVSICAVLALNGVIQIRLSEDKLEWYQYDFAITMSFKDDESVTVEQWKSVGRELKEWLGDEFRSLVVEGKCESEEEWLCSLYPGESLKKDIESNNDFTYEQSISDEKIIICSKYNKLSGDYYEYGGEKYKIVGKADSLVGRVPMNSLPEKFRVKNVELYIEGMMSNTKINKIVDKLKEGFDAEAEMEIPKRIDLMQVQSNNMVALSAILSAVILVFNAFVCYYYIFNRRKKWLIVARITGCSKAGAMVIYAGEIFIIAIADAFVGLAAFVKIVYPYMVRKNNFYSEIYTTKVYIYCTLIFIIFSVIISFMGIVSTTGKSIIELKKK